MAAAAQANARPLFGHPPTPAAHTTTTTTACHEATGLQRVRCERSRALQAICGEVSTDVRPHCERCFMAGHTIACEPYQGEEHAQCEVEKQAMTDCSEAPVDTFMQCLAQAASSPANPITAQR